MFKQLIIAVISLLFLNAASAQTAKTAQQYYDDGIKLQDEDKFTEAFSAFKNAIAKNPGYKEALYSAGWICNELTKYTEALPYLQKAKSLWQNEAKVYLELGYTYKMLDKKTDAVNCYNKCLSLKEDYSLAYKYLGILYYDDKDYKNALVNLESYLDYTPDCKDEDIYYRKAVSENEMEKYEEALVSINKANDLKPSNVKIINETGYTYYMLEKADDALKYYTKALDLDSKSLLASNGRADVYRKLKKDGLQAIKYYAKTLEIDDKNIKANYMTGWCYNDLERYSDAVPFLKKVIAVDDKYVDAYTELGYCDYALKNYDDALVSFRKAIAIEKTALTLYYTGLCFVGKKEKVSALKMVKDLDQIGSDYAKKLQAAIDKM